MPSTNSSPIINIFIKLAISTWVDSLNHRKSEEEFSLDGNTIVRGQMYLAAPKHLNASGRSDALLIHPRTKHFSFILQNLHTLRYMGHLMEVKAAVDHRLS